MAMDMGCEVMAKSYRKMMEKGKRTKEQALPIIEVYEFLGERIEDGVIYNLFDTGYFNDILKSYIHGALQRAGVDDKTQDAIRGELKTLLDMATAKEVCDRY
jgi:hypothetical protein